jgi:hypothetical protein
LKIWATLWDYDCTRLPTLWNIRIPNVTFSFTKYESFWWDVIRQPPEYWSQSNPCEYLLPIQRGQADDFLIHLAFLHRAPKNPSGKMCFGGMDQCHRHQKREFFCFCSITLEKVQWYWVEFVIPIFTFPCM